MTARRPKTCVPVPMCLTYPSVARPRPPYVHVCIRPPHACVACTCLSIGPHGVHVVFAVTHALALGLCADRLTVACRCNVVRPLLLLLLPPRLTKERVRRGDVVWSLAQSASESRRVPRRSSNAARRVHSLCCIVNVGPRPARSSAASACILLCTALNAAPMLAEPSTPELTTSCAVVRNRRKQPSALSSLYMVAPLQMVD